MSNTRMTRDERLRRQKLDDGEPIDTVWMSGAERANGQSVQCYHDTPDCPQLNDGEHRDLKRADAKLMWRAPCKTCVIGEWGDGE